LVEVVLVARWEEFFYQRHDQDASVTKLIPKPKLPVLIPEVSDFEQLLSSKVCARTEVQKRLLNKNPADVGYIDVKEGELQ
jgi:hypothetical protein